MENLNGYTLVAVPSDRLKPLHLLVMTEHKVARDTDSTIDEIFKIGKAPLPIINENYTLPSSMNNDIILDLKVSADLKLLEGLLKLVKSNASTGFNYNSNSTIKIKLLDPKSDSVPVAKLDAYIHNSTLNDDASSFISELKNDKLFVVTEIMKCKNFTIENISERKTNATAEVTINQIGETKNELENSSNRINEMTYTGDDYLTVGLKAWRIFYEKEWMNLFGKGKFRIRTSDDLKIVREVKKGEEFPGELMQPETIEL